MATIPIYNSLSNAAFILNSIIEIAVQIYGAVLATKYRNDEFIGENSFIEIDSSIFPLTEYQVLFLNKVKFGYLKI